MHQSYFHLICMVAFITVAIAFIISIMIMMILLLIIVIIPAPVSQPHIGFSSRLPSAYFANLSGRTERPTPAIELESSFVCFFVVVV